MQRRNLLSAALAAAALSSSGCANLWPWRGKDAVPAPVVAPGLQTPEPGMALIYVLRPAPHAPLIRFNVFLDGKEDRAEMGYTRPGQYIYFSVPPGKHRIYSKAENWAEIEVTVSAGATVFIQQEPTQGNFTTSNTLSALDEVQRKGVLEPLALGTVKRTFKRSENCLASASALPCP